MRFTAVHVPLRVYNQRVNVSSGCALSYPWLSHKSGCGNTGNNLRVGYNGRCPVQSPPTDAWWIWSGSTKWTLQQQRHQRLAVLWKSSFTHNEAELNEHQTSFGRKFCKDLYQHSQAPVRKMGHVYIPQRMKGASGDPSPSGYNFRGIHIGTYYN